MCKRLKEKKRGCVVRMVTIIRCGGGAKATHPSIPNTMMMATCIIAMIVSSGSKDNIEWMMNISSGYPSMCSTHYPTQTMT